MRISPLPEPSSPSGNVLTRHTTNQSTMNESPSAAPSPVSDALAKAPESSEPFASKYAEIAKREKAMRDRIQSRERALAEREAKLKAQETEYQTSYIPKAKIPEMFQRNATEAMRELGLSGDQLTQYLLNQPSPQDLAIQDLKAELASLKGLPDQTKKMMEERESQQREQAIHIIRSDVKSLVESDPSFEVLKASESLEEVVNFMVKKSDEEGLMLSPQEAAQEIEKQLTEEIVKYAKLPKIQKLLQPEPAATPLPAAGNPGKSAPPPKVNTLAHSQVSSASKPMSPRERAIALLEGRL